MSRLGKRYANAPIIEAVIEFRVMSPDGVSIEDVARVHLGEESRYPVQKKRVNFEGQLEVTEDGISSRTNQRQLGFTYSSGDGREVFHSTIQGLALARLAPYDRWEPFAGEAWRLWKRYCEVVKPDRVERISVRYINRIDIPQEQIEIKDYLRTYPELSPDLPQVLSGFFMQAQVPLVEYEAMANITSAIEKPSPETVSLLLDIDCQRGTDLDVSASDFDETVMTVLEDLRRAKNAVFEACITDETRRLID